MRNLFLLLAILLLYSCSNTTKQEANENENSSALEKTYYGLGDLNSKDFPYREYIPIMNDWGTITAEVHRYVFNNKQICLDTIAGKSEDFKMLKDTYKIKKIGEGKWEVSYKRYLKSDTSFVITAK